MTDVSYFHAENRAAVGRDTSRVENRRQWERSLHVAKKRLVLVLDDDQSVLGAARRLLKAYGFDVQLFETPEEFFDRANLCDAICLVLDIHLKGTSGIELKRQLVASGVLIPVIFITANDNESTRKAALEVGCVAYLSKPFTAESLINAIETALDQSGPVR